MIERDLTWKIVPRKKEAFKGSSTPAVSTVESGGRTFSSSDERDEVGCEISLGIDIDTEREARKEEGKRKMEVVVERDRAKEDFFLRAGAGIRARSSTSLSKETAKVRSLRSKGRGKPGKKRFVSAAAFQKGDSPSLLSLSLLLWSPNNFLRGSSYC